MIAGTLYFHDKLFRNMICKIKVLALVKLTNLQGSLLDTII